MYIAKDYQVPIIGNRGIVAIFKDGREVNYTTDILPLLLTDKDIDTVYDTETGEVIFCID